MFKILTTVSVLLLSCSAHAATYKMAFEFKDGIEPLQKGTTTAQEGKETQITAGNKIIRFKAVGEIGDTVKISSIIMEDSKVVSSPTVIVRLGQSAEITHSSRSEKTENVFSLKWTPELASTK